LFNTVLQADEDSLRVANGLTLTSALLEEGFALKTVSSLLLITISKGCIKSCMCAECADNLHCSLCTTCVQEKDAKFRSLTKRSQRLCQLARGIVSAATLIALYTLRGADARVGGVIDTTTAPYLETDEL
jgi:hypothetical protein